MTRSTRHFGIDVSNPAFWMTICAVLAIWLGVGLSGAAHRIGRARQLLSRLSSSAHSASDYEAVVDILHDAATSVMRASATLVIGGLAAVILAACFDWASKRVRIALVCCLVVTVVLLPLLQGIS